MTEKATSPAIGYSITANVNGDRQVVFQHFVDQETSVADQNAMIDRIMDAIDRQQARYRIPELRTERNKLEAELLMAERDLAAVDLDYQARVEVRNRAVADLQSAKKGEHDAGYAEHTSSGRRGSYEPVGHRKQRINAIEAEEKALIEAAARDDAERQVARSNLEKNNELRRLRMKQIDEELAELQAKVS